MNAIRNEAVLVDDGVGDDGIFADDGVGEDDGIANNRPAADFHIAGYNRIFDASFNDGAIGDETIVNVGLCAIEGRCRIARYRVDGPIFYEEQMGITIVQ